MHAIDLPPYVSKKVLIKHAVPPRMGAGHGLSVVNCATNSGRELEEGDEELEERGWIIGEGRLDHQGPGAGGECSLCHIVIGNVSGEHLFLDQGTQVARLGELMEVSLHAATEEEARLYQVQGDPSPNQVDPAVKKKKVLEELNLDESPFLRCDPQLKREVEDLVGDFLDVFTDEGRAVGRVEDSFFHSFRIQLEPGARPVKEGIRPLSHQQKEALKEQLRIWLRDGVIRPGTSPWGSALVPVRKKDGSMRWTID